MKKFAMFLLSIFVCCLFFLSDSGEAFARARGGNGGGYRSGGGRPNIGYLGKSRGCRPPRIINNQQPRHGMGLKKPNGRRSHGGPPPMMNGGGRGGHGGSPQTRIVRFWERVWQGDCQYLFQKLVEIPAGYSGNLDREFLRSLPAVGKEPPPELIQCRETPVSQAVSHKATEKTVAKAEKIRTKRAGQKSTQAKACGPKCPDRIRAIVDIEGKPTTGSTKVEVRVKTKPQPGSPPHPTPTGQSIIRKWMRQLF